MPDPIRRDLTDPTDTWWDTKMAADHFGLRPAAIRTWIRNGDITTYPGGLMRRAELLELYATKQQARASTRYRHAEPAPDSAATTNPG